MPIGVRLGVGARTGRGLPWGKAALGGYGLGKLTWVLLSLVWARYLAPSLPSAAAAAVPSEAPGALAGPVPRTSGVPGAGARLDGAAVAVACVYGAPLAGGAAEQRPGRWRRPPRPAPIPSQRFRLAGGRLGLLGRRPDQDRGLRQLPLLAPRRGVPSRTLGRRGSMNRGGGGGGRPARGSHRSLTSLLSW